MHEAALARKTAIVTAPRLASAKRSRGDSRTLAGSRGVSKTLEALRSTKTVLPRSYKRGGTPVPTPVSIGFDGDRAFFRSYDRAWKTKRLRNTPASGSHPVRSAVGPPHRRLRRAPCSSPMAKPISPQRRLRQHRILQGLLVPITHRLMGYQTIPYELTAHDGWAE